MAHLIIKNVGPIKNVDIELNKVNIIMGPQSSGKSTINKIACYCSWVEKKVSLDQSFDFFEKEDNFINELVRFHKLEGYVQIDTYIEYESDVIKFRYSENKLEMSWKDRYAYKQPKISYIPSERNIIATIPNWFEVKFEDNNIRNFMAEWGSARKPFTKNASLNVLDLGISYYYDSSSDTDFVRVADQKDLKLTYTSSGLQSIIPLNVLVEYLTRWIYSNNESESLSNIQRKEKLVEILYNDRYKDLPSGTIIKDNKKIPGVTYYRIEEYLMVFPTSKEADECRLLVKNMTKTQCTKLYVEEPEQNLFPSTQRDLLYYMVGAIKSNDDHKLFITTHSPYILYALNNCMMGYLVKDKMPEAEANEVSCRNSWINPELVSVWEIKDGELRTTSESRNNTIQGEDGLISDNYFDENMKEVMDDFYKMLNYYGDDKDED